MFSDNDEVIEEVTNWFDSQAAMFYDVGISNLVSRCDKYIKKFGDYVEKYLKIYLSIFAYNKFFCCVVFFTDFY